MCFLIWDCPEQFKTCGRVMWSGLKSLIINHLEKKNVCLLPEITESKNLF